MQKSPRLSVDVWLNDQTTIGDDAAYGTVDIDRDGTSRIILWCETSISAARLAEAAMKVSRVLHAKEVAERAGAVNPEDHDPHAQASKIVSERAFD